MMLEFSSSAMFQVLLIPFASKTANLYEAVLYWIEKRTQCVGMERIAINEVLQSIDHALKVKEIKISKEMWMIVDTCSFLPAIIWEEW